MPQKITLENNTMKDLIHSVFNIIEKPNIHKILFGTQDNKDVVGIFIDAVSFLEVNKYSINKGLKINYSYLALYTDGSTFQDIITVEMPNYKYKDRNYSSVSDFIENFYELYKDKYVLKLSGSESYVSSVGEKIKFNTVKTPFIYFDYFGDKNDMIKEFFKANPKYYVKVIEKSLITKSIKTLEYSMTNSEPKRINNIIERFDKSGLDTILQKEGFKKKAVNILGFEMFIYLKYKKIDNDTTNNRAVYSVITPFTIASEPIKIDTKGNIIIQGLYSLVKITVNVLQSDMTADKYINILSYSILGTKNPENNKLFVEKFKPVYKLNMKLKID